MTPVNEIVVAASAAVADMLLSSGRDVTAGFLIDRTVLVIRKLLRLRWT